MWTFRLTTGSWLKQIQVVPQSACRRRERSDWRERKRERENKNEGRRLLLPLACGLFNLFGRQQVQSGVSKSKQSPKWNAREKAREKERAGSRKREEVKRPSRISTWDSQAFFPARGKRIRLSARWKWKSEQEGRITRQWIKCAGYKSEEKNSERLTYACKGLWPEQKKKVAQEKLLYLWPVVVDTRWYKAQKERWRERERERGKNLHEWSEVMQTFTYIGAER